MSRQRLSGQHNTFSSLLQRKRSQTFLSMEKCSLLLTRTKRSLKVKANLLFPVKLLHKRLSPSRSTARSKGPNFQHCMWPWGLSSLCHGRRAASRTNHPGGLSALSLCSLKCLCCQILTGTRERSSSPVSGSHVTGTALHWEHGRDTGLAGGMGGVQYWSPEEAESLCYTLSWHARGTDPGLHRRC